MAYPGKVIERGITVQLLAARELPAALVDFSHRRLRKEKASVRMVETASVGQSRQIHGSPSDDKRCKAIHLPPGFGEEGVAGHGR